MVTIQRHNIHTSTSSSTVSTSSNSTSRHSNRRNHCVYDDFFSNVAIAGAKNNTMSQLTDMKSKFETDGFLFLSSSHPGGGVSELRTKGDSCSMMRDNDTNAAVRVSQQDENKKGDTTHHVDDTTKNMPVVQTRMERLGFLNGSPAAHNKQDDCIKSSKSPSKNQRRSCATLGGQHSFQVKLIETIQENIHEQFEKCFQTMYENGHIPFPAPYRRRSSSDNRNTEMDSIGRIASSTAGDKNNKAASTSCNNEEESVVCEYSMKAGLKHGFKEIVMQNNGRFEMNLSKAFRSNYAQSLPSYLMFQDDISLSEIVSKIFNNEPYQQINVSIVISTPGAEEQKWHTDGGHLDIEHHLPCHCLNVFVPLVDVLDANLGPTEFRPGSHYTRNLAPMILGKALRAPVIPLLQLGDVLIFDYRVLHRERANVTLDKDRPILVLTFAKTPFRDVLNFPRKSIHEKNTSTTD